MPSLVGQTVVINKVAEMGEMLIIDTDRSLTGQDGVSMTPDGPGGWDVQSKSAVLLTVESFLLHYKD
jgi:hypothetical protein